MNQPARIRPMVFLAGLMALVASAPKVCHAAGLDVIATESIMVQATGPRAGEPGKTYANVQGDKDGTESRFAGFAILDFPAPRPAGASPVQGLTLTLTQSVAKFTRDGKIRFYLAADAGVGLEALARPLKYNPKVAGGLGDQIPKLVPLGVGAFAKGGTGDADPYPMTLDDAARKAIQDRLSKGGTIRVVMVPEDMHVAATFFGSGAREAKNRPKLTIETTSP